MAIIKCKMCGGNMELSPDKTFGTCEYCGSTMTLPKVEDDQRAAAFNRGNHFRRIGEFDKALAVYERIVQENEADAEAHWCCALCRFGIEYVEDPATYEWVPTCHRASFDSFLEDVDYLAAVEHSDGITKRQYQKDAAKIAEVQKGILATSQNEKPFDVFICYKETDGNGERTRDSILAQEIYYQLTEQGRRVFFARITLEDKIGTQYEPYIFAALNSAKVMVVVGTSAENLNAVWVKNEWSRFLSLMKKDRSKLLLPCYRDMDPYDLPEQLSVLQSYDISKIGFIQDLTRGIAKVLDADKRPEPAQVVQQTVVQQAASSNMNALLKRGTMALEDGEWAKADGFFEEVLNQDAECAAAYLGKLMAELQVRKQENLKDCRYPFEKKSNYQKVLRFADQSLCEELKGYIRHIEERNEHNRLENLYARAADRKAQANSEDAYKQAAEVFAEIPGYRDADSQKQDCLKLAENARKDAIYEHAMTAARSHVIEDLEDAIKQLQTISGWKDVDQQIYECRQRFDQLKAEAEAERLEKIRQAEIEAKEAAERARKIKKILKIAIPVAAVCVAIVILINTVIIPNNEYKKAIAMIDAGQYEDAIATLERLDEYKDSETLLAESKYIHATTLLAEGDRFEAADLFLDAYDYSDSTSILASLYERKSLDAGAVHTVGLKTDGSVVAVGKNNYGECDVDGWTDIVAVSAGLYSTVGLKADGTVVAVGKNNYGECDVDSWTDIVAVSAGLYSTVGLKADGTVVAVGKNNYGECDVDSWTDIVAVSAGTHYTVGLKDDGSIVAVGNHDFYQWYASEWDNIVSISTYDNHNVGIKADDTVVTLGDNDDGRFNVDSWTDIIAVSAGSVHTVGLKADGTVVAVGNNRYGQCDVDDWIDIVAIATGDTHTVGLKADGTVVATGENEAGQCNVSDWIDIKIY